MRKIEKPILELSGICRSDKKSNIEQLSLSVPGGDSFGVLYKNDSSISLLLEILAGRIPPKKGKVFFKGDDVTDLKNIFGVVTQQPSSARKKNVCDAAAASIVKRGLSRELAGVLVKKELAALGLSELSGKSFSQLGALDAAKAHIFCAYMCSHEFMVIDEPFSALSGSEREEAVAWLNKLRRGSKLSLLTFTKDVSLAAELSDCVMVVDGSTASAGMIAIEKGKERLALERLTALYETV